MAYRDNIACMHELPMEALGIFQGVCLAGVSCGDGSKVLSFLAVRYRDCSGVDTPEKANVWDAEGECDVFCMLSGYAKLIR